MKKKTIAMVSVFLGTIGGILGYYINNKCKLSDCKGTTKV